MEICFVPVGDYASYIEQATGKPSVPGNFVDVGGHILGQHKGIIHYTVGQRKGLGLALGYPAFVVQIRPETNEVVIGSLEHNLSHHVYAREMNFMGEEMFDENAVYQGKIRYNHAGAACHIVRRADDLYECIFEEPQRGVTPGQALVLYRDGIVAGGGTICRPETA